jgi:hypothetical protein
MVKWPVRNARVVFVITLIAIEPLPTGTDGIALTTSHDESLATVQVHDESGAVTVTVQSDSGAPE